MYLFFTEEFSEGLEGADSLETASAAQLAQL
jgi:hypothetical protein